MNIDKEELTKKFKLVKMEEVDISSLDYPIIGTQALATCVGVLLYSEKHKKAIVAHVSSYYKTVLYELINMLSLNGLLDDKVYYYVIRGYYRDHYDVYKSLNMFFEEYPDLFYSFPKEKVYKSIAIDKDTCSKEFAFDSIKGVFVTNNVFFGEKYNNINNSFHK